MTAVTGAVEILVPDDGINRRERWVVVGEQINGARLSPTGQRVLFEARGNLFNAPVGDGNYPQSDQSLDRPRPRSCLVA